MSGDVPTVEVDGDATSDEPLPRRSTVPGVPAVSSPGGGHRFRGFSRLRPMNLGGVPAVPAESLPIVGVGACVCAHLTRNSFLSSRDSRDTRSGSANTERHTGATGSRGVPGGKRDSRDTRDTRDTGWSA